MSSGSIAGVKDADVWLWMGCDNGELLQCTPACITADAEVQGAAQLLCDIPEGVTYKRIIPVSTGR